MDTERRVRLETAKTLRRTGLGADFWPRDFKERPRLDLLDLQREHLQFWLCAPSCSPAPLPRLVPLQRPCVSPLAEPTDASAPSAGTTPLLAVPLGSGGWAMGARGRSGRGGLVRSTADPAQGTLGKLPRGSCSGILGISGISPGSAH